MWHGICLKSFQNLLHKGASLCPILQPPAGLLFLHSVCQCQQLPAWLICFMFLPSLSPSGLDLLLEWLAGGPAHYVTRGHNTQKVHRDLPLDLGQASFGNPLGNQRIVWGALGVGRHDNDFVGFVSVDDEAFNYSKWNPSRTEPSSGFEAILGWPPHLTPSESPKM